MTVQASLLDARIPMSTQTVDIPGALNRGYTMRGNKVRLDEEERQIDNTRNDDQAMQEYLQGGGDLSTPPGATKAVNDLKGKVSPAQYAKLVSHAQLATQKDTEYKEGLNKLTAQDLSIRSTQTENTLKMLATPLDVYNSTKAIKGEADAAAEFQKTKETIIGQMAKSTDAGGRPLYPPELLESVKSASPQVITALLAGTKYHKDLIDERLKLSTVARNEAAADLSNTRSGVLEETGGMTRGAPSEIAKIDMDVKAGRLTPEQGDAMKKGIVAKKSGSPGDSGLTPEAIDQLATKHYLSGDLPPRLSPAERTKILNRSAQVASENGDDAEAASIRKQMNKSRTLALNDITKRETLIGTYERDADKRLSLVLELAKKADTTGIPALNRWINAGRQNIAGDVDVNNFNSAMISAQAELARILSGALTNAATSDSARAEAAQIINKNMSMEQLESLIPNIRRELKFKKEAFADERKDLTNSMGTPKGQASRDETRISPETQAVRDKDRVGILADELTSLREKMFKIDPKDPATIDQKVRLQGDIDAAIREMKQSGVKDPDAEVARRKTAKQLPAPAVAGGGWSVVK